MPEVGLFNLASLIKDHLAGGRTTASLKCLLPYKKGTQRSELPLKQVRKLSLPPKFPLLTPNPLRRALLSQG